MFELPNNSKWVPRMLKSEWPEHIASGLGIPTVFGSDGPWISNGDTTDVSWFLALCSHLDIPYPGERIRAMEAIMGEVGGEWDQNTMSSAGGGKKPGGNVRKEAFEALWSALVDHDRLPGQEANPAQYTDAAFPDIEEALPEIDRVLRSIARRRGQPAFRKRLLIAYDWTCAITGTDLDSVLEAAHIRSHTNHGTMSTKNGLLLRADMHTMFDLGQIAVDASTWTVLAQPRVRGTHGYEHLHGTKVTLPKNLRDHPDPKALNEHRRRAGL